MRPSSRHARAVVAGAVLALLLPLCTAVVAAPAARALATVTFGAAGDHQATANARAVLRGVGAARPDFFMSLGDLSYDQLTPDAWCQMVKDELNAGAGDPAGSAYGETFPFAITQGNHEMSTIDSFLTPTCLPDRLATTAAPGSTYGHDYVLDYPVGAPTVRIISTSPGLAPLSYRAGGAGLQWLSDMIDAGRAAGIPWIVVTNHLNYISASSNFNEVGGPYFNLLVDKKVDLVLQGHDHNYQRSKQLALSPGCPEVPTGVVDPDCIVDDGSDGVYQAGSGPVLVISGAGGAPLYPVGAADSEAGYFATARGSESGSVFGWSKVTATDTTLQLSYQSTGATALQDSFTITKGPPPPPDTTPPSAPSGVSATAIASRVDVSWSAAVDDRGVTGYQVWRDGVQLATVPGTSYADNGALPGTSYSYTVRAVDAAANVSADSLPALVTTPPVSSVLFSETWPGADGSAWPAAWTTSAAAGGVVDTRAGAGALSVAASTSGSNARAFLSAGDVTADSELLTRFAWSSTAAASYASIYLRGSGGWQNGYRPLNCYGLELASTSTSIAVRRNVGGVVSTIASPAGIVRTTAPQWIRFRVEGSSLRFRTWMDGTTEPSTWTWSGTDTAVTAPGRVHLSLNRSSSSTVAQVASFDDLTVSSTTLPPPPPTDTTPPSAPGSVAATAVADEREVEVSWSPSTDDVAVVGYEVLRDGVLLPGTVTGPPFLDPTVVPGATYTYAVRAFDGAGNRSTPASAAPVTVPVPPDTAAPSTPVGLVATPDAGAVALSWQASTDDTAVTGYDVLRDGVLLTTVATTAWTDTTAAAGSTYTYGVRARDAAGNTSAATTADPVTVPLPDDTTPPTAPVVTATPVSGTGVLVSWTASIDDVGVTAYDVLRDGVLRTTTTTTTFTDAELTPATTYGYTVRARDAAGNSSTSVPAPVTTPDTIAPTAPTGVTASALSGTSATVSWTAATDNVAVTAYDVLLDGVLRTTTTTTTITDAELTPATTYGYTVRARDAAGNISALSASAGVTTPAASTELFRDTWTLPDLSPWGSSWTPSTAVNGRVTTASDTGQLSVPPTSRGRTSYGRALLSGVPAASGTDVTFSYRWGSATAAASLNVYLRGSGGWQSANRPRNGYGVELSSGSSTVALRRTVNGSTTTLASTSGAQQVGTTRQSVRIQVTGSTVRYRTWVTGQTEPTTWRASVTDTSVSAAGQLFVSLVSGSGGSGTRTLQLDDLVVSSLP